MEQILEKSDLAQIDIEPSQLEFKTSVRVYQYLITGYFVKGTQQLVIGRYEYVRNDTVFLHIDLIDEGMFKGHNLHGFGRKIDKFG